MTDAWGTAERVCEALRDGLADRLVAVALFGSHARGDAHPDSDLDVLVIADALPDDIKEQRRLVYGMLPHDLDIGTQLVVYSRERFLRNFPSFYLDLGLDAKVLLDTDGLLEGRLARIREITRRANLARERLGKDWHWEWTDGQRRGRWEITWEGYRDL